MISKGDVEKAGSGNATTAKASKPADRLSSLYVENTKPAQQARPGGNDKFELVIATHEYVAQNPDELNLKKGMKIKVIGKEDDGYVFISINSLLIIIVVGGWVSTSLVGKVCSHTTLLRFWPNRIHAEVSQQRPRIHKRLTPSFERVNTRAQMDQTPNRPYLPPTATRQARSRNPPREVRQRTILIRHWLRQ